MEDLTAKISELLGSPEGLEKIQSISSLLGGLSLGESQTEIEAAKANEPDGSPPSFDPEMMGKLMQFLPLISQLNEDDKNTLLIKALKPHLSVQRQERAETAITLLRLFTLLPLLEGKLF